MKPGPGCIILYNDGSEHAFCTDLHRYRTFAVGDNSFMTGVLHIRPKGHFQNLRRKF